MKNEISPKIKCTSLKACCSDWLGRNCGHHLRCPGSTSGLTGAAESVQHPHWDAEYNDAPIWHPTHPDASRYEVSGCRGSKRHHTKSGDDLLVLQSAAACRHAQEPHSYGMNASTMVIVDSQYF